MVVMEYPIGAAVRAEAMGYDAVHIMAGGAPAWGEAGYTLYAGVNVPSKTFGELLELERHTPRMTAQEVNQLQESNADHVIVDGRPFSEYTKFNIPGGICCPNGELALRIGDIVPDSKTTIVVNCAGRTRSILGAQTLIDAGITNPVFALENGTQGWFLAGLELQRGAVERHADDFNSDALQERRDQIASRARSAGVRFISATDADTLRAERGRTTYLFDVRTDKEYGAGTVSGAVHAPGGQLVQATDQWVGVRGARIIVFDDDMIRAPMVAYWLSQLGHEALVLEGGLQAAAGMAAAGPREAEQTIPAVKSILAADVTGSAAQLIDVRGSMAFREGHIEGARWSIRPRLAQLNIDASRPVVLIGGGDTLALAAKDLAEAGCNDISQLGGGPDRWRAAGLNVVTTGQRSG